MRMEQEIIEIHGVFMDLATLVSLKGDELNRMEDHVNGDNFHMPIELQESKPFLSSPHYQNGRDKRKNRNCSNRKKSAEKAQKKVHPPGPSYPPSGFHCCR